MDTKNYVKNGKYFSLKNENKSKFVTSSSFLSDDDDDDDDDDDNISVIDWLEEEDNINNDDLESIIDHKIENPLHVNQNETITELSDYLKEHYALYEVMQQVPLFMGLSQHQQEQVLNALQPADYKSGDCIVRQGDKGDKFYMIVKGKAAVRKTVKNSQNEDIEIMLTHLYAGHYFGELALLYDDARDATVQAIESSLKVMYLTRKDFQKIEQVYLSLMLKQVPLLAQLNPRDQDTILNRLQSVTFNDGEFIVRQGDAGDRFYIITRGEAVVTENLPNQIGNTLNDCHNKTNENILMLKNLCKEREDNNDKCKVSTVLTKELTRLYEGHCFGETSLIFDEPRSANVQSIGLVTCLYLTKKDFQESLNFEQFHQLIHQAYAEKALTRAMRIKNSRQLHSKASNETLNDKSQLVNYSYSRMSIPTVIETNKLTVEKLANGEKLVNKYIIKGDIGRGSSGRVQLAKSEEDGILYAIKILPKTFASYLMKQEDSIEKAFRQEVAIMKKLHHPNIVRLIEVIDDPSCHKLYIVQEYIPRGNLNEILCNEYPLSEDRIRKYMHGLLLGLQYLHFHQIIHRDIKPENLLVTETDDIKIVDFGAAKINLHESETLKDVKGTPAFMAPELFDTNVDYIGPAVDIWSLGATLYMLITGKPPWMGENEIELSTKIQQDELVFPSHLIIEPHLRNLIQRMLTKNPEIRISLSQIVQHEWVTKEGSEPLSLKQYKDSDHFTVTAYENAEAISNIPQQIDKRLQNRLEEAHHMILSRKSLPKNRSSFVSAQDHTSLISAWRSHKRAALLQGYNEISDRSKSLLMDQKSFAFSADRAQVTEIILPASNDLDTKINTRDKFSKLSKSSSLRIFMNRNEDKESKLNENIMSEEEVRPVLSRKKDFIMITSEVMSNEMGNLQKRKVLFQAKDDDFSVARFAKTYSYEELSEHYNSFSKSSVDNNTSTVCDLDIDIQFSEMINEIVNEEEYESEDDQQSNIPHGSNSGHSFYFSCVSSNRSNSCASSDYSEIDDTIDIEKTFEEIIRTPKHLQNSYEDIELSPLFPQMSFFPTYEDPISQVIASDVRQNLNLGLRIGFGSTKGQRPTMEDRMTYIIDYCINKNGYHPSNNIFFDSVIKSCAYFAVYDGHNGDDTAQTIKEDLHHTIFHMAASMQSLEVHPHETMKEAIYAGFEEMEETLLVQDHIRLEKLTETKRHSNENVGSPTSSLSSKNEITFSGSTATVIIFYKLEAEPNHVYFALANLGDSRAVLCNEAIAFNLTSDHKASCPSEKQRIEEAGGFVHNDRLNGVLAVSRSFGDIVHKTDNQLIATPDVSLDSIGEENEFILIASDGLFDVITSQQAINFIKRKLSLHGDVQLAAQELVSKAMAFHSNDNISVIIICLNQMELPFYD